MWLLRQGAASSGAASGKFLESIFGTPPDTTTDMTGEQFLRKSPIASASEAYGPAGALSQVLYGTGAGAAAFFGKNRDPEAGRKWLKQALPGAPDTEIAMLDMALGFGLSDIALTPAAKVASVPIKMAGRATEPLRHIPWVGRVGRQLSEGFDVPAYVPGEAKGQYLEYVMGKTPSLRDKFRMARRQAAGEGQLLAQQRHVGEDAFLEAAKIVQNPYRGIPGKAMPMDEAQEITRDILEELPRAGTKILEAHGIDRRHWPVFLNASKETQGYYEAQLAAGVKQGLRKTELGSAERGLRNEAVTKQADIDRLGKELEGIQARFAEAKTPEESAPLFDQLMRNLDTQETVTGSLRQTMAQWEQNMNVPLPRTPAGEIDIEAALPMLKETDQMIPAFMPQRPSPSLRRAENLGAGARGGGGVSTSLGMVREEPALTTASKDVLKRSKPFPEYQGQFGSGAQPTLGERLTGGTVAQRRAYMPHLGASELQGTAREAAVSTADLTNSAGKLFGKTPATSAEAADLIGQGWVQLSEATPSIASGVDDATLARLRSTYIPKSVAEELQLIDRAAQPENLNPLFQGMYSTLRYWKPLVTVTRPEFWVRNFGWSKFIQMAYGNVDPMNDILGIDAVRGASRLDPIPFDAPQLRGVRTMGDLKDQFLKYRIINTGRAAEIGRGAMLTNMTNSYQFTEDALRASFAIHLIRNGATLEQAAQKVSQVMFDYGPEAYTFFEQQLRKYFVPFLGWAKNVPRLAGRSLGEIPSVYPKLGTAMGAGEYSIGLSDEDKQNMGNLYTERGGIPYALETVTMPNGKTVRIPKYLSYGPIGLGDIGAYGTKGEGLLGTAEGMVQQLAPVPQMGLEFYSGKSPMTGAPEGKWVTLPAWAHVLEGVIPEPYMKKDGYGGLYGPPALGAALRMVGPVPNIPFDLASPYWTDKLRSIKALTGIPLMETTLEYGRKSRKLSERARVLDEVRGKIEEATILKRAEEKSQVEKARHEPPDPWADVPAEDPWEEVPAGR